MSLLSSRISRALAASFVTIAVVAACGSEGGSSFDENGKDGGGTNTTNGGPNNGSSGSIVGNTDAGTSGSSGDDGGTSGNIDPNCKAQTCAQQNIQCGLAGDGCGRQIDCGGCKDNERCGGPGAPSQCVTIQVATTCTPKTCTDQKITCGQAGDGCGNLLDCGKCAADEQCGAIGRPSQCVKITASEADGGTCVPKTKTELNADGMDCGKQSDGCGGTIDLGGCVAPEFCGGGGPSKCAVSGGGTCTKKTCNDYPADVCGPQSDGCGGVTASCGAACVSPQVCGGGGVPGHCGGGTLVDDAGNACTPKNCLPSQCGDISDGCGGIAHCGNAACTGGEFCGGGGTPNQCGKPTCTAATKATACNGLNCGTVGDGCGGTIDCTVGTGCTAPAICGGGGKPNVCGGGVVTADGGPGGGTCIPKTNAACTAGDCGPFADGCGGSYTCGTAPNYCPSGQTCGLGGASKCGANACVPKTRAVACSGLDCGIAADGCGCAYSCWPGGSTTPTCSSPASGPPLATGTCPDPRATSPFNTGDYCGGGGANKCGGGTPCTGTYCGQQPSCTAGQNGGHGSTISGTVFAPNGTLPIHDAIVYIPNQKLDDVPVGVSGCDTCVAPSGAPFVQTHTNTSGVFRLDNVPVPPGGTVTLVIQKGRWRKVLQNVAVSACANVNLSVANGTFGSTQTDTTGVPAATHIPSNNIPKYAVTSGGADSMQCLLRRIGIADEEFGNPGSIKPTTNLARRVNIYHGASYNSTTATSRYRMGLNGFYTDTDRNFPEETTLYGSASTTDTSKLKGYDGVVLTCTGVGDSGGSPYANYTDDMKSFADGGGKIFASHWHHSWLHRGPTPWPTLATFDDGASQDDTAVTEYVNMSVQKGTDLANWLQNARGNSGTLGQLSVKASRQTVSDIDRAKGTSLITKAANDTGAVQYSDFLMPSDAAANAKCGRFVLSDLHVAGFSTDSTSNGSATNRCSSGSNAGATCSRDRDCGTGGNCSSNGNGFPDNCASSNALSDQEKVLAYMLFDLTSCVDSGPPPNQCTKLTCDSPVYAGKCGVQSDGCGGVTAYCHPCTGSDTCGAVTKDVCGHNNCTPTTCPAGTCSDTGGVPNGCGGLAGCQPCPAGDTCGGGGQAGKCGHPNCTALKCGDPGVIECGQTGDGCGGTLTCSCPAGKTCGGGGQANKCGACTPITTCPAGLNCGQWPDGCGGAINCGPNNGNCDPGQACGAGGQSNVCGVGTCTPKTCTQLGAECGQVADGCGNIVTCPNCPAGDFCNGQNICVPPTCQPKTCTQLGVECGPSGDTCGGFIPDCGTCGPGTACGANGTPGKCGTIACTPLTCNQLSAECGQVADGCGGLTPNCGSCPGTKSCKNGACVTACTPRTCADAGAECGFIGDGCGGALDCGSCSAGKTCGFGGIANKCGQDGPH